MKGIERKNCTFWVLGLTFLFVSMTGCTLSPKPILSKGLLSDKRGLPSRLVFLPPNISVNELSAGGIAQEDPEWSRQAKEAMTRAVLDFFAENKATAIVSMPELSPQEQASVHEHLLLYDVVAAHAYTATRVPAMGWGHKIENFDYSIGKGLRFLKEKSSADAGLFIIGADYVSTGGRKAMVAMGALLGVGIPIGNANLQVGIVDLETGTVLWFNNLQALASRDLRNYEDSRYIIGEMFKDFR